MVKAFTKCEGVKSHTRRKQTEEETLEETLFCTERRLRMKKPMRGCLGCQEARISERSNLATMPCQLQSETNGDQFETYLRPLQVDFSKGKLTLLARISTSEKSTIHLSGKNKQVFCRLE